MATTTATGEKNIKGTTREADINRKLQLYGIISGFQSGKIPSNEQIDVALNSFLASHALDKPSDRLSPDGKSLVQDVREVIKQAKYLALSKNDGNLLQDFIYQTTHFDTDAVSGPSAPVDKDTAKKHGNEAKEGLRTLGTLIITNGQFRKLLKDATTLLRDMAGDAATNAASKVRPSQDSLQQIDRPAEDNTWHEAPDFSKGNLQQQAKNVYGGNLKEDAKAVAQAGKQGANADVATNPQQVDTQGGINAAQNVAKDRIGEDRINETKENLKARNDENRRKAREYLKKKMPQERREQTIWRLKKMILECQQHPDYARAIQTLLDLAEEYGTHGRHVAQASNGAVQQSRNSLANAEANLKTLIERFANGTSSDDLLSSIEQIYKDADQDQELKNWFKSINLYIRRCLLELGYILDEESSNEWDRLYDHGRYLLREKYRAHTDRVLDEVKFLMDQFDQDSQNRAFSQSLQKLFNNLGHDENNKVVFKPHLFKDITDVIVPGILSRVEHIPIPRIEYSDNQVDVVIDNVVLESSNFMPASASAHSEHNFKWGSSITGSKSHQVAEIDVQGVRMELRDVSYYIKRKQGFPSITDTGVATISLLNGGFGFKIKMSTAQDKDSQNFFKVENVDVDVKKLKVKVTKSNHKLLISLLKPIILSIVRPIIQKTASKSIKDQVHRLDGILFEIKKEADSAKGHVKEHPEDAPNVYKRYMSAMQNRALREKKKAQDAVADKKVNVAVTKDDYMFKDIKLDGSVSNKATEYKELSRKGDTWHSEVFSIGSASRSNDIPPVPKVVRKPHDVTQPGSPNNASGLNGNSQYGQNNYNNYNDYNNNSNTSSQYNNGTPFNQQSTLAGNNNAGKYDQYSTNEGGVPNIAVNGLASNNVAR